MAKRPSRVVIIGFDAPIVPTVQKHMKAGKLPNLAKLCRRGVWGNNCLVPHPTITPPNWTTIVTGAWPGTHGITCFNVHNPGDPLDVSHQGFHSEDVQAEYFWNAAAREGKSAIVMNYPTTHGPSVRKGIRVGGAGLAINEWRDKAMHNTSEVFSACADTLFTTELTVDAEHIETRPASGWKNAPRSAVMMEAELPLPGRRAKAPLKPTTWHLLLVASKGRKIDTALVCPTKDAKTAFAKLKTGKWSPRCSAKIKTEKGTVDTIFHMRLRELSSDGSTVKLYVTPLCQTNGWAWPAGVCAELAGLPGLPIPNSFFEAFHIEWIDDEMLVDLIDMQNQWLGAAAAQLMTTKPCDIFAMHAHGPDHCYHVFINDLDPDVCKNKKNVAAYQAIELGLYRSLDRMVGTILKAAGDDALVLVTSDHGAVPTAGAHDKDFKGFNTVGLLTRAGLTAWKKDRKTGEQVIDWSKTKAYAQRSVYIYVNVKGRDPQGIVKPSEVDTVCDKIINTLYDYTDPKSGTKPISFALKKCDARLIGLHGDHVGDVVFALRPEVEGEHGRQAPTARFGVGDMHGIFIMAGPGVRKNAQLDRTIWLTDIVPTICYLTGLPVPAQAEGAVIYQALSEPSMPGAAEAKLREELEKLQAAKKSARHLTHSY